ncbi:hypothetical protein B0H17DRAFT_1151700 [Mycena rosella]|uniref:Uncharacterized protein n=1 Tax=Mycena rosella TaxID=1033263 RepID=A0AAD7BIM7_MYCRO|nr:hypothetical protein B0H17DRAFT_1151700 [Mycena rosella]
MCKVTAILWTLDYIPPNGLCHKFSMVIHLIIIFPNHLEVVAVERINGDPVVNREEFGPYPAIMHTPHGRRRCTSGPPTWPKALPLENLLNQLHQESPRLQNCMTRQLDQLSPRTPTSRDHWGTPSAKPLRAYSNGCIWAQPHEN